MADQDAADKNVEMWKIKKLIKSLEAARGNGTSMISLIIPVRFHLLDAIAVTLLKLSPM